jgi:vacuolar-type H+-ATPase subunit H
MQKLEEILRAEEAARHEVASARERAESIVREAESDARQLLDDVRADGLALAKELRLERLSAAEQQARVLTAEIAETQERVFDAARSRMRAAMEAALERVRG